jgi:hypothetical protein
MTVPDDPFAVLGLPARAGLTDDEVRAAWRRIAAAAHPDREDGGDPARFGAAAAAYVLLRTSFGRGEALADLGAVGWARASRPHARRGAHRSTDRRNRGRRGPVRPGTRRLSPVRLSPVRFSTGRLSTRRLGTGRLSTGWLSIRRLSTGWLGPGRLGPGTAVRSGALTLPVASAAVVSAVTVAAAGLTPATIGLLTGALTVTGWALWRQGGWGR